MHEKDNEKMYLTESDKRELMLEIEELAQLEGLRSYAKLGSEYSISADTQTLINSKADKTETLRHDGSVCLTEDWDIGNGRVIKTDKIIARDSDGLALFDDGGSGIFIKDGGNVGIGTANPQQKFHIAGNPTYLEFQNTGYSRTENDFLGSFLFYDKNGDQAGVIGYTSVVNNDIKLLNRVGAIKFYVGADENAMYISSSKLVGIGTITPSAKLAINGGLHVGGDSDPGDNNILIDGNMELDGDLNHDGSNIGFFGVPLVTRQSALTSQFTTITCSSPGTPDYAIADPVNTNAYGWTTADEFKTVMSVIANLQTRVSELEAKLRNYGLLQ